MKQMRKGIKYTVLLLVLVGVFFLARYGWRIIGYYACEMPMVADVSVEEGTLKIDACYDGKLPKSFVGYFAQERDGNLFIGFKFNTIFGVWFGDDSACMLEIPVEDSIRGVYTKSGRTESLIWHKEIGQVTEQNVGVYVKVENPELHKIQWIYVDGDLEDALVDTAVDISELDMRQYVRIDTDIPTESLKLDKAIPFTVTAKQSIKDKFAVGNFIYEPDSGCMYIIVTEDGEVLQVPPEP